MSPFGYAKFINKHGAVPTTFGRTGSIRVMSGRISVITEEVASLHR